MTTDLITWKESSIHLFWPDWLKDAQAVEAGKAIASKQALKRNLAKELNTISKNNDVNKI
jgi:hypothetical protein